MVDFSKAFSCASAMTGRAPNPAIAADVKRRSRLNVRACPTLGDQRVYTSVPADVSQ